MDKDRVMKQVARVLVMLISGLIGLGLASLAVMGWRTLGIDGIFERPPNDREVMWIHVVLVVLAMLIAQPFAGPAARKIHSLMQKLDAKPMMQIFAAAVGLVMGLVIALLITQLFNFVQPGLAKTLLSGLAYLVFGYLGVSLSSRRWRELMIALLGSKKIESRRREAQASQPQATASASSKILDTSVVIDGRIFDLCKTGFVEGMLVVPQFVLHELQHIADSSDALRRNRGRRGLDVLQRIQKELPVEVHIEEADYEDIEEVDVKLLKLAQDIGGIVMTNDYNLNKVASVSGVRVLNINELANALKPVVMHGEEMAVQVVREGKEPGQGVGYLDDGTMIVVDNGKHFVGQQVEVMVTTVLQTAAGRMIFTKMKGDGSVDKVG